MTGRWSSPGTPVSSTNKTDRHDITEILLKVVLNTISQPIKVKSLESRKILKSLGANKPKDINKGNNKITELRTILQRESQNS